MYLSAKVSEDKKGFSFVRNEDPPPLTSSMIPIVHFFKNTGILFVIDLAVGQDYDYSQGKAKPFSNDDG